MIHPYSYFVTLGAKAHISQTNKFDVALNPGRQQAVFAKFDVKPT